MGSLIVGGARTPIGKLLGGLKDLSATDLGGHAIAAALARAGVTGDQVDYVIMGQVLQAGAGQIPARQAAVKGGIPMSVPALTVNKVCLSGLNAIALADQLIRAGECELVVAGGMESMTQAPHLLPGSRAGIKYGNAALVDSMAFDGLWDVFTDQAMGALTEDANHRGASGEPGGSGRVRGAFAPTGAGRHECGAAGRGDRAGDDPAAPRRRPGDLGRRGHPTRCRSRRLWGGCGRPSPTTGTITAGSASQISDGAAAVVVASPAAVERLGLTPVAEIGAHAQVAGPDSSLQLQPAAAIELAVKKAGLAVSDLELIEINEAFAAVGRGQRSRARAERGRDRGAGQRPRWGDRSRSSDRGLRCPPGPAPGARTATARGAGWPPRPCVAAAGRATPCCCRLLRPARRTPVPQDGSSRRRQH